MPLASLFPGSGGTFWRQHYGGGLKEMPAAALFGSEGLTTGRLLETILQSRGGREGQAGGAQEQAPGGKRTVPNLDVIYKDLYSQIREPFPYQPQQQQTRTPSLLAGIVQQDNPYLRMRENLMRRQQMRSLY